MNCYLSDFCMEDKVTKAVTSKPSWKHSHQEEAILDYDINVITGLNNMEDTNEWRKWKSMEDNIAKVQQNCLEDNILITEWNHMVDIIGRSGCQCFEHVADLINWIFMGCCGSYTLHMSELYNNGHHSAIQPLLP